MNINYSNNYYSINSSGDFIITEQESSYIQILLFISILSIFIFLLAKKVITNKRKKSDKTTTSLLKKLDIIISIQYATTENTIKLINVHCLVDFRKWIDSLHFSERDLVELLKSGRDFSTLEELCDFLASNGLCEYRSYEKFGFSGECTVEIKEFLDNRTIEYQDEDQDEDKDPDENDFSSDEEEETEGKTKYPNFTAGLQYVEGNAPMFEQRQFSDIEFMKNNPIPEKNPHQGVINDFFPNGYNSLSASEKISSIFQRYLGEFIDILVASTNQYLTEAWMSVQPPNKIPWFTRYGSFSKGEIKLFLAIWIFAGIQRIPNMKYYWDQSQYLLSHFNSTISTLMSYSKFKAIHRCLHYKGYGTTNPPKRTDFEHLFSKANDIMKKFYNPGLVFSFDDDLYKWTGKGGEKKIVPGKADRVGNTLWKLVDSNGYIYHFEMEHYVKQLIANTDVQPRTQVNQEILKRTVNALKESIPHPSGRICIIIDAGILGSLQNAEYLSQHKYHFIISVAINKCKSIVNQLLGETNLQLGEYVFGSNSKFTAILWQAKRNKQVNILTNIPEPICKTLEDQLRRSIRQKPSKGDPSSIHELLTPRCIWCYNNCHNYVDSTKMVINPTRNIHRCRTYARVVFNDVLYVLLYNSYTIFHLKEKQLDMNSTTTTTNNSSTLKPNWTFQEYLIDLVNCTLIGQQPPKNVSRNCTIIPNLKVSNFRVPCHHCRSLKVSDKDIRVNYVCPCHDLGFHRDCNILFHNPKHVIIN